MNIFIFVNLCNNLFKNPKVFTKYVDKYFVRKLVVIVRYIMENENFKIDESIKRDFKECKEKVEFLEKILTMLVKGFASEY